MDSIRPLRLFSLIFVTGAMALGLAACGSDNGDSDGSVTSSPDVAGKTTGKQGGQVTPGKNAPDSAGDRKKGAPDDAISDRPGGPSKPASP